MTDSEYISGPDDLSTDTEGNPKAKLKKWLIALDLAEKNDKDFKSIGKEVVRFYKDEKLTTVSEEDNANEVKYNIYWSMVQTVSPAIYNRPPVPVVRVKQAAQNEPDAAKAAFTLESQLRYGLEEWGDFHGVVKRVRDDYLLPGRGVLWANYVVSEDDVHEVEPDYVYWEDFRCSPARTWAEVSWVARRHFLTKKQIEDEFGVKESEIKWISDYQDDNTDGEITSENQLKHEFTKKAEVWEIWDKEERKVYFVCPGYTKSVLGEEDDPLGLEGFFPTPEPLAANVTTDSIVPTSDYKIVQDIVNNLNELTKRASIITEAIRAVCIFDPAAVDLQELFTAPDNLALPAENWEHYKEAGGFDGVAQYAPIQQYVDALAAINQQRQVEEQNFYTVTGFSDVLRASATPYESATNQTLKAPYATLRLSEKQAAIQTYLKNYLSIVAEIICAHFPDSQLEAVCTDTSKTAIKLLKDASLRAFSVTVETDSTITINEALEKQERIDFLNMMSQFFNSILPIGEQLPAFMPLALESFKFGLRAFRAGYPLLEHVDNAIDAFQQDQEAQAQEPPEPDPEIMKIQNDMQKAQMQAQTEMQKTQMQIQAEMQQAQIKAQIEMQKFQAEMQAKQQQFQLEMQKLQVTSQTAMQKVQAEIQMLREELGFKREKQTEDIAMDKYKADLDANVAIVREQLDVVANPPAMEKAEREGLFNKTDVFPTNPEGV